MCARFVRHTLARELAEAFGVDFPDVPPSFNVAPTQSVLAVRIKGDRREGALLRWGLVPAWAKDLSIGAQCINARAETVATKPAFRAAYKKRRCLVVADGYYEWKPAGKRKQPCLFRLKGREPFAFAGLWEHWERDGQAVETCALLTTEPNDLQRPIHDRMPVVLSPEAREVWLDPAVEPDALAGLLGPFPAERMECYPVSTDVGNPRNNRPDLIRPLAS